MFARQDEDWLVKNRFRTSMGLALLFMVAAAQAHHAFSMFDMTKTLTLMGTVKEFQWNNPHSFIQLLVPVDGAMQEWSIEMGSPMNLMRIGWKPTSLRAGDKVTVVIHPAREVTNSGSFISGMASDGKRLGN
jgi:hypothetical protein